MDPPEPQFIASDIDRPLEAQVEAADAPADAIRAPPGAVQSLRATEDMVSNDVHKDVNDWALRFPTATTSGVGREQDCRHHHGQDDARKAGAADLQVKDLGLKRLKELLAPLLG